MTEASHQRVTFFRSEKSRRSPLFHLCPSVFICGLSESLQLSLRNVGAAAPLMTIFAALCEGLPSGFLRKFARPDPFRLWMALF